MQYGNVVKVKFIGPTDTRGARWSATLCDGGMNSVKVRPVVISHDPGSRPADGAHRAAVAAMEKYLDNGGRTPVATTYGDLSSSEYVFIFA